MQNYYLKRLAAAFIDTAIGFMLLIIIWMFLGLLMSFSTDPIFALFILVSYFVAIILSELFIHAYWPAKHNGQSFGKKFMKLKIVDKNGKIPSMKALVVRRLAFVLLLSLTSVVILIVIPLTEKKQGVHDLLVDSRVIAA